MLFVTNVWTLIARKHQFEDNLIVQDNYKSMNDTYWM